MIALLVGLFGYVFYMGLGRYMSRDEIGIMAGGLIVLWLVMYNCLGVFAGIY